MIFDYIIIVSCLLNFGVDFKGQVNGLYLIDILGQLLLCFNYYFDIVYFLSGFSLKFLIL